MTTGCIETEKEKKSIELISFCGGNNVKKVEYAFWYRLATSANKSEIAEELRKLRKLEISGNLPLADVQYFDELKKAVRAEFRAMDKKIEAQKIIGKRRGAEKAARDHRLILLGIALDKLMSIDADLKKRVMEHLDMSLSRDTDRKVFIGQLPSAVPVHIGESMPKNQPASLLE